MPASTPPSKKSLPVTFFFESLVPTRDPVMGGLLRTFLAGTTSNTGALVKPVEWPRTFPKGSAREPAHIEPFDWTPSKAIGTDGTC